MTEEELRIFATEWVDILEAYSRQCMNNLGVSEDLIGLPNAQGVRRAFNPNEFRGGGVNTLGMEVDAGVFKSDLLGDKETGQPLPGWHKAQLRYRIEAVVAHEWTEFRFLSLQSTHELALQFAPQTHGVSPQAMVILEEMRDELRGG